MHNIRRGEISTPSVELKKLYLLTKMCSSVSRKSYVYLIIFPTIPSPSPWKWVSCSIPTISFFTLLLYIEWILQILSIMQQKIILYFFFVDEDTLLLPDLRLIPILSSKEKQQTYTFDMLEKILSKMQLT